MGRLKDPKTLSPALVTLGLALTLGCARPEPSVCDLVPTEVAQGSLWAERTPERQAAYQAFYSDALRSLEGLTPEDLYTFVRQGALGGLPVQPDDQAAADLLRERYLQANPDLAPGAWTPLDPEGILGRLHLGPYRGAGMSFDPVLDAAVRSSTAISRDRGELDWRMCVVRDLAVSGALPLTEGDWPSLLSLWQSQASPGHSLSYRHYRQPAYVVLRREEAEPLLAALKDEAP